VVSEVLVSARHAPAADRSVRYPGWYLQRWHFLPEGYLSPRSVHLYDRWIRRLYHAGQERRALRIAADAVTAAGHRSLLEVGCGPGRWLAALRGALPGRVITGVDLSPYCVEAARECAGPGVPVLHADGAALPWPHASFDAILFAHVLGHVPHDAAGAMLAEARRVLRAGGTAIIVDHAWHDVPLVGWRTRSVRSVGFGLLHVAIAEPRVG
jgi:ubiquinone/menaquinone biosynthesis C-methylase UbiE